jgi:hypothetical protein
MRSKLIYKQHALDHILQERQQRQLSKSDVKEEKEEDKTNAIIKQKIFKHEEYLKLLSRFIDEHCEYKFMNMISLKEVKDAYYKFLNENYDTFKHLNITPSISPKDINLLNKSYEFKRVHVCKSCNNKQFSRCCDGYELKNRTSVYYLINLKLK